MFSSVLRRNRWLNKNPRFPAVAFSFALILWSHHCVQHCCAPKSWKMLKKVCLFAHNQKKSRTQNTWARGLYFCYCLCVLLLSYPFWTPVYTLNVCWLEVHAIDNRFTSSPSALTAGLSEINDVPAVNTIETACPSSAAVRPLRANFCERVKFSERGLTTHTSETTCTTLLLAFPKQKFQLRWEMNYLVLATNCLACCRNTDRCIVSHLVLVANVYSRH